MTRNVALIYVRVSRLDRGDRERVREDGPELAQLRALSPRTQIEQVRALPALHSLTIEVFEDLHRSGKNTARPGLERLRERMRDSDVAVVAVWSMSRLGRSVRDLYDLIEEMQDAGVAFVSAKESVDTSTASGRAFFGILATLAQFERELTSERLVANLEQVARDGGVIGPLPFGYRRRDREVVIDEPAARVLRTIFREYATGKYSYRDLASWLNENGHRPPEFRRSPPQRPPARDDIRCRRLDRHPREHPVCRPGRLPASSQHRRSRRRRAVPGDHRRGNVDRLRGDPWPQRPPRFESPASRRALRLDRAPAL